MSKDTQKIQPLSDAVKKALADVRAPNNGPNAFVVLSYNEPNALFVKGEGQGGVTEAMALCDDSEACYVFIRKDMKVEMAKTVKFAWISWIPNALKPMRRALISTHKGQIKDILSPFHADVDVTEQSEISEEIMTKIIGTVAGIESHAPAAFSPPAAAAPVATPSDPAEPVVHAKPKPSPLPPQTRANVAASQPKFMSGGGGSSIPFDDEGAFMNAVKQVHNDKAEINWLLAIYEKKLSLVGTGSGGVSEVVSKINPDAVNFALVRVTEVIDNKSKTTKFAYVRYIPVNTKPMVKGDISAKRGALDKLFQPYHVDFDIETQGELSEDVVMDRITNASGSKSHVLHRD